jgi:hypothetical protein
VSTAYPRIGFDDAASFFLEVLTPAYSRFGQSQTRSNALLVAQAGWAMIERHWHDSGRTGSLEEFRRGLFTKCPELELLRDHAEGGKHFGLDRPKPPVTLEGIFGEERPGGTYETAGPQMPDGGPFRRRQHFEPECTLAMKHRGQDHSVAEVLGKVIEFWRNEITTPATP